ncbi:MAG: hypothetical protein MNPFHGCM_02163 [Gemmatimonadaceae bacterium]|nr:hypothetical protein [Gemmatimonadaceae bacterium]
MTWRMHRWQVLLLTGVLACARVPRNDQDAGIRVDDSTATAPSSQSPPPPAPERPSSALRISELVPDSAAVPRNSVVEVLIRGSGFEPGTPGRNVVELGPVRLTAVPANETGTEIRFVIPDRVTGQSEAPPRPLMPGSYPVRVTTAAGVSNSISFKVLP